MTKRLLLIFIVLTCFSINTSVSNSAGILVSNDSKLKINDSILRVDDNIQINSSFIVTDGTITVAGNWSATGGSFFVADNSTVYLNGSGTTQSINGDSTFFNLIKTTPANQSAGMLMFASGSNQTIENNITLKGASGNLLLVKSDTDGVKFGLTLQQNATQDLDFIKIKDSDASKGQRILPVNSVDLGGNSHLFPPDDDTPFPRATIIPRNTPNPTPIITATPIPTPIPTPILTPVPTLVPTAIPLIESAISGNVVDANLNPVQGLIVDVFKAEEGIGALVENSGVTDENGNFVIIVPPGIYKVAVDTANTNFISQFYNNVSTFEDAEILEVFTSSEIKNINFVLLNTIVVRGVVRTLSGELLNNLSISAFNTDVGNITDIIETDETGSYSFELIPGVYNFFSQFLGKSVELSIDVEVNSANAPNEILELDFVVNVFNIGGMVTDSEGLPISDMFIKIQDSSSGEIVNIDITDIDGEYIIPVIPGEYIVTLDVETTNLTIGSNDLLVEVINADVTVDFVLEKGSAIKGNILDSLGVPVENIVVEVFDFSQGFWVGEGISDLDGNYEVSVPPGVYKVGVDTSDSDFATQFYNNEDWSNATPVELVGNSVENIDFSLQRSGFISGTVTDGSAPLSEIVIDVFGFDNDIWINSALTNEDGLYSVAVGNGTYKILANGFANGFKNEFFVEDGSSDIETPVDVEIGETVSNIDFELTFGKSLSGVVTSGVSLLDDILINVFDFDTNLPINGTFTINGAYTFDGLSEGDYLVRAFDPAGRFASQYYDNVIAGNLATAVHVPSDTDVSDIDFNLLAGSTITGRVSEKDSDLGLKSITVEAYDAETGQGISSVDTDPLGNYVMALASGNFKLRAFDISAEFSSLYYNNALSWNEADDVLLAEGEQKENIDFELSTGSFISGNVNDNSNKPLNGIDINVFDFELKILKNSIKTNNEGSYKIGIPAGRYLVASIPDNQQFTSVFYDNAIGWDNGIPVSVSVDNPVANINFRLFSNNGNISGKVVDESNSALPDIVVKVFDERKLLINEDITNSQGLFSVAVPQGKYRVWASPLRSSNSSVSEFYDDKKAWEIADSLDLETGQEIILNDIRLILGRSISGFVKDESETPLPNIDINLYNFESGAWVNSAITDKNGFYKANGLPDGDYRVNATPASDAGLIVMFFENAVNWDGAERVEVSENNADVGNINFTLIGGEFISGRVVNANTNKPVSGIKVNIFELNGGAWVSDAITNGLGLYTIPVPVGVYFAQTDAAGTEYIDSYYDGANDIADAKPIVITAGLNVNVDFRLNSEGAISGKVKDISGAGIAGAEVNVFNFNTQKWINNGFTNSAGDFQVNVHNGEYFLSVRAPFESNFSDKDFTEPFEIIDSENFVIDDIVLSEGRGVIEGNVQDSVGSNIEGVKIKIFKPDTNIRFDFDNVNVVDTTFTDKNGNYSLSVSPGDYIVKAIPENSNEIIGFKYFDNKDTFQSANIITIASEENKEVDFVLNSVACINGKILSDVDSSVIPGLTIHVFKSIGFDWVADTRTDEKGDFSICLPNDVYKVAIWDSSGRFEFQFFNNVKRIDRARDIVLDGKDLNGISFLMENN